MRPRLLTSRYVGIRPAPKNIVTRKTNRIGRCSTDPGRESPYAASTGAIVEMTVPFPQ